MKLNRWLLPLLALYGVIIFKAVRDCRKLWRQAKLLRAVMGK